MLERIIYLADGTMMVPVAFLIAIGLLCGGLWRSAILWLGTLLVGMALIAIEKLAFDFYGWSIATIAFYSISGHAMLAAAVYPMLLCFLGVCVNAGYKWLGLGAGLFFALVFSWLLVSMRYHTLSETVFGAGVGALIALWNCHRIGKPHFTFRRALVAALPIGLMPGVVDGSIDYHSVKSDLWQCTGDWMGSTTKYYRTVYSAQGLEESRIVVNARLRKQIRRRCSVGPFFHHHSE